MTETKIELGRLARAFLLVVLIAGASMHSLAQTIQEEFRTGEVVVELKPGADIDAVNARNRTGTIERLNGTNFYRLATPNQRKENKFRKRLSKDPDVLSASLNPMVMSPISLFGRSTVGFPGGSPTLGQAQSQYTSQQLVDNLEAVHYRSRGAGVVVAVVDTGVNRNHPDIISHLWLDPREPIDGIDNDGDGLVDDICGWDFVHQDNNPTEGPGANETSIDGHGTFIAGLIALVAPKAKIMSVRAFDSDGVSDAFTVAAAIKYAADHGAQVINLSFGSPEDSQVMHDAVTYARGRGALLIAAVGNDDKNTDNNPQFPAKWSEEVMGIAAVGSDDRKAQFSNFGSNVSVSAPGVDLFSIYPKFYSGADYAVWSGTSFAAPLATAEAALILEDNSHADIRSTIENTATNIDQLNQGFEGKLGSGRINPLAALQSFQASGGSRGEINLMPVGPEPHARGRAGLRLIGDEQEFEVTAGGHSPRSSYKIVVDGTVILDGARQDDRNAYRARASNFGSFRIRFSTSPDDSALPLPAALTPVSRIKRVEVRDSLDRVVIVNEFGYPAPGGGSRHSIEKEANLVATGSLYAKGRARAEVTPEREQLRFESEDLTTGVAYQIVADGISLGTFVARWRYIGVEFTSDDRSDRMLPEALRPVTGIQRIELRDPSGQIVLAGNFRAGGDDFGGGDGGSDAGAGVSKDAKLNRKAIDADAEGEVKIRISASRQSLQIKAEKLSADAEYSVVVDGYFLGNFKTDGSGSFEVKLSPDSGDLPDQLRPVSKIQNDKILDSQGRAVLTGGPPG